MATGPTMNESKLIRGRRAGDKLDPHERALAEALPGAAERGEFFLVYQTQIRPEDRKVVGVECLLRWDCPTRGSIGPDVFAPIAERHGLIRPITRWVLNQAMQEMAAIEGLKVGLNASALEFADPAFVGEVAGLIALRGFDPRRLEIEITETAILVDGDEVRHTMDALHKLGVRIALDDFGAGYSSLNHLRLYPFDCLKIDKAFVAECSGAAQSAALIHAVVGLGKALGMSVTAEGVETEEQLAFLRLAEVDAVQGYLFGEPVRLETLRAAL